MEEDDKKKLVALGVLIIVLVVVWYLVLFGVPGGGGAEGTEAAPQKETAEKESTKKDEGDGGEGKEDEEKEDKLTTEEVNSVLTGLSEAVKEDKPPEPREMKRDPFHLQNVPEPPMEELPELKVTVILSSAGKGTAVINGTAVSQGDTLGPNGNVKVRKIESESVTVVYSKDGRKLEKKLTLE